MARKILVVDEGQTRPLTETAAANELELQELLKQNPDLLPIEDFGLTGPLLVVGRETRVHSGAMDLVGVARGGELVLIEFKTGPNNPDFRHALAQLLDYGSHLWRMELGVFEAAVARPYFHSDRCPKDSAVKGAENLAIAAQRIWDDLTEEEIRQTLERLVDSLKLGAFHFVTVAQRLTDGIIITMRYLNNAMPQSSFHAVELVRFDGDRTLAYEARTVHSGTRERRTGGAAPIGIDEAQFLERIGDEGYKDVLSDLLEAFRGFGLRFEWGSLGTSIRMPTPDRTEPLSIGWLFPPGVKGWMGLTNLTLGYDPASAKHTPCIQSALDEYLKRLETIEGAVPVGRQTLNGFTFEPVVIVGEHMAIREVVSTLSSWSGMG